MIARAIAAAAVWGAIWAASSSASPLRSSGAIPENPSLQPVRRAHPKDAVEPVLDVTVKYERDGRMAVLSSGDVLTGNDNYRIIFEPSHDSYVYVFQIDTRQRVDGIFPNPKYSSASNPVSGKIVYSVPPEGRWLHLDRAVGTETIVVFASDVPVADPHAAALKAFKAQSQDGNLDISAGGLDLTFSYRLTFEHR